MVQKVIITFDTLQHPKPHIEAIIFLCVALFTTPSGLIANTFAYLDMAEFASFSSMVVKFPIRTKIFGYHIITVVTRKQNQAKKYTPLKSILIFYLLKSESQKSPVSNLATTFSKKVLF